MGTLSKALPKGGEVIYEVIRVQVWLLRRYLTYAKGIPNLFFMDRLSGDEQAEYYRINEKLTESTMSFLGSKIFATAGLGRQHMAYGDWVDWDLTKGILARLEILSSHPVWSNFDLEDRVKAVSGMILESALWCGAYRAAAWKGESPPDEPPYTFTDKWNARHAFATHLVPIVVCFGPEPSNDDT